MSAPVSHSLKLQFAESMADVLIHATENDNPVLSVMTTPVTTTLASGHEPGSHPVVESLSRRYDVDRIVVHKMLREAECRPAALVSLRSSIKLLSFFVVWANDGMERMHSRGLAKALVRSLFALASYKDNSQCLAPTTETCCMFLEKTFHDGYTFVADAIDAHVFYALLKLADSDNDSESFRDKALEGAHRLFFTVKRFLVYRSVLNRMDRERDFLLRKFPELMGDIEAGETYHSYEKELRDVTKIVDHYQDERRHFKNTWAYRACCLNCQVNMISSLTSSLLH